MAGAKITEGSMREKRVPQSDRELILGWLERQDAEAFRAISLRHAAMVYSTSRRILGDASEAEDVVQECFQALAFKLKKPTVSLGAWLHRVATNLSIKRIRSKERRRKREAQFAADRAGTEDAKRDDLRQHVDQALAILPDQLRIPLVLYFLECRSQGEIARQIGTSRSTISNRIQKGIEKLRADLKRSGLLVVGPLAAMLTEQLAAAPAPASVLAGIGRIALAGTGKAAIASSPHGVVLTLGGILAMKKLTLAIATAILVILCGARWHFVSVKETPTDPIVPASAPVLGATGVDAEQDQAVEILASDPGSDDKASSAAAPLAALVEPPTLLTAAITGRVYDADTGEPSPGAEVIIELISLENVIPESGLLGREIRPQQVAKADERGEYRFESLSPGKYRVKRSNTPGLPSPGADDTQVVTLAKSQIVRDVDFAVARGIRVAGIVVDSKGHPVHRAEVQGRDRSDNRSLQVYTTGEDGAFELFGFHETRVLTLEAESGRRGSRTASEPCGPMVLGPGDLSGVVLTLHPTASISGRLVDERGNVVVNALIHPSRPTEHGRLMGQSQDRTDEEGRFELRDLAAGSHRNLVLLDGTGIYRDGEPPWSHFEVESGERVEGITVVVKTGSGLEISGRVLDKDRAPVRNARVSLRGGPAGGRRGSAMSDPDGYFRFINLEPGEYELAATHRTLTRTARHGVPAGSEDIEIVLGTGSIIEGQVFARATGEPIEQFEILHLDDRNRHEVGVENRFRRCRDADGRFRLENIQPGAVTIIAKAPGFGAARVRVPRVEAGTALAEVHVALGVAASLTGIVIDALGHPVANAGIVPGRLPSRGDPDALAAARTGDDGKFFLTDLPEDLKVLSAFHDAHPDATVEVVVSAGSESRVVIRMPAASFVQGTVYQGEHPVPDREVRLIDENGRPTLTRTEAASASNPGAFRFENVSPGRQTLTVPHPEPSESSATRRRWLERVVTIEEGTTRSANLRFRAGTATVRGTIVRDGRSVAGVEARLVLSDGPSSECRTTAAQRDGSFLFKSLPSGPAALLVRSRDGRNRRLEFRIDKGATIDREINLSGGLGVRGTVSGIRTGERAMVFAFRGKFHLGKNRSPVVLSQKFRLALGTAEVRGDGPFVLEGLEQGRVTILAIAFDPGVKDGTSLDLRIARKELDLQAKGVATMELVLE